MPAAPCRSSPACGISEALSISRALFQYLQPVVDGNAVGCVLNRHLQLQPAAHDSRDSSGESGTCRDSQLSSVRLKLAPLSESTSSQRTTFAQFVMQTKTWAPVTAAGGAIVRACSWRPSEARYRTVRHRDTRHKNVWLASQGPARHRRRALSSYSQVPGC